jgi:predicted secreted protein
MQFVLMFGVMLILAIPCLFVLLRIAVRSQKSEDHPGTWNLESQTSCALDHAFYLIMFAINYCDMLRLI